LTVETQVDATGLSLSNVQLTIDGNSNSTNSSGLIELMLVSGSHTIKVNNVGTRIFSHFWDHDCDDINEGWYLDTFGWPIFGTYNFEIFDRTQEITLFYKTFTKITDTAGNPNTFEYDGSTIKGKLLDENNNAIVPGPGNYHPVCEDSSGRHAVVVDKNVTLEYFDGFTWNYLGTTEASGGSWSYPWGCKCGAKKLRASYIPTNWYYMSNSTEINVVCPCKLTVNTFLDLAGNPPVPSVSVTVDGILKTTNALGIAEFFIKLGSHTILVEDPKGSRPFSHFWDHDCDGSGDYLDTNAMPYTFTTWEKDKEITAFYKTFTYIKDSLGNINKFDYDGTTISGKLQDEVGNPIGQTAHKALVCGSPGTTNPIDRNVTLEYSTDSGKTWIPIKTVDSLSDGAWSYSWTFIPGTTNLRASYIPTNWYYVGTSATISIYVLRVFTTLDVDGNPSVPNVDVTVDENTISTGVTGIAQFFIKPGTHNMIVENPYPDILGSRLFSHFWDHDCNSIGGFLDTNANPYTFTTWSKDRNITAFYKTFTYIKDTAGNKNKFEYDGSTIKGKLQDEIGNPIGQTAHKALVCGSPGTTNPIDRNVTLEYYDGSWNYLDSVESSTADGSWSKNWVCSCNTTKIRASYYHSDWYYNSTSTEINVDPSLCPCKLTVFTQVDAFTSPLSNVQVAVDGTPKFTDVSGKTEFMIKPGSHTVTSINPFIDTLGLRQFSHFWDSDCNENNLGWFYDTAGSPFSTYAFNMYKKDRNITTQYKTFTKITNSLSVANTFDFDGITIKGKLLDERNGAISLGPGHKQPVCDKPDGERVPINRNVTLEYFDGSWHYIGVVDSLADGSWSLNWNWVPGVTKLRANYTPSNWYYVGMSVEITVIRCSGEISVSNDATTCGSTTFTDTVTNTGSALTIEMADELWTDPECDNIRNNYVTGYYESDISISAGQTITRLWSTPLANNPGICYIHSIWFCSKPLDSSNLCWKGSDICYNEGNLGNIKAKWNEKEFKCGVPPQCSDGIDNDGDGLTDFPNDPGCTAASDNDERDYKLNVSTLLDINWPNNPRVKTDVTVTGVDVAYGPATESSGDNGIAEFDLPEGTYDVRVSGSVIDPQGTRLFSHYWDHNCSEAHYYDGWGLDTGDNSYRFRMYVGKPGREIWAFYKSFTKITDTVGTVNTFDYVGSTISGYLKNELGEMVYSECYRHDGCTGPADTVYTLWKRNMTLEYSINSGSTWIYIDNVTISPADASWSKTWSCVSGANKLRARYVPNTDPKDWYLKETSAEISIAPCCGCIGASCTLNSDCLSNFCSAGICKCNDDIDCCLILGGPCSTNAKCGFSGCVCGSLGSPCPV